MAAAVLREGPALAERFRLVLASQSPRRRELLQLLGLPFDVATSGFAEDLDKSKYAPGEYTAATAKGKCEAVLASLPPRRPDGRTDVVLCADTVVAADGAILEKPADREAARAMLSRLSGRTHEVFTGVVIAVKGRPLVSFVEKTEVTFSCLSQEEIDAYIDTGEPFDKAGGYGIQSKGGLLVQGISGDYFNVVGLPVASLARHLLAELRAASQAAGQPPAGPPPAKRARRGDGAGAEAPASIDKLALVLVRDRRQLVARSRGKTAFFTPGGKREPGESDEEALLREVKEELNVDVVKASIRSYGVFQAQAHGKPEGTMVRMTCYTADYVGTLEASGEIEELKWISSAESDLLTVTGVMLLEDLKAKDLIG